MKTLARLITLLLAATIAAAPAPLLAQQKQDTMGKKEPATKKAKKKAAKKDAKAKEKSGQTNPAPGPK